VKDLFRLKLDLVLWDTTSTYFEGEAAKGLAGYWSRGNLVLSE